MPGSAGGNAGTDEIQLTLADSQAAIDYNFAVLGVEPNYVSLRMYLASTGSLSHYLTTMHSAPTVATGDSSNPNYSATYTTFGAAVPVTASDAAITATDSPTLASMTVSIENPPDGSSEVLSATTTGTNLTQSYSGGVLTISGVADVATYDQVLRSVTYKDTATSAHVGNRTISVEVNDGTDTSQVATSTITVVLGTQTAPTVTAVASTQAAGSYASGTTIPITVTFSNAVTVTGAPQIALNDGGTATYSSGSGTATLTFNYTVATGQNTSDLDYASTSSLTLNGGTIQDSVGNTAVLTLPATGTDGLATRNIIVDTATPVVTAVSTTTAAGAYGTGTTIPITVTFGETVNVTGTPQLALNDGAVVNYTSGSGTAVLTFNYTVAAGQNTNDLDYSSIGALTLPTGANIVDAAGNAAVLALPTTGTDGLASKNIVIESTAPTVTGVTTTQSAGVYGTGTTIPITVTFDHAVNVTGTPQLTLNALNGSTNAVANYVSGTGSTALVFNYIVAAGDGTTKLDYASTSALSLNGGTIQDLAGNAASLTLPAAGTDGLFNQNIAIDATARNVTGVSTTKPSGAYTTATVIPITVTFGEAVTVTGGAPQLALNSSATALATYASGSGTTSLVFNYTVVAGDNATQLDYTSTSALSLPSGASINDSLGNPAILTLPAPASTADALATQNISIETAPATVSAVSSTVSTGTYGLGASIPITLTFSHPVIVTGTPQLTLNDGAMVNYASGSGTAILTFNYVVAAGQNATMLDYASTDALALNGGTILDAVGAAATLTLPATGTDGLAAKSIAVDTTPPQVSAVSSTQTGGVFAAGDTIPITVTFGEAVNVTGTPQLTLNDGAVVDYASGSGSTTLTFNYIVAANENTQDLDYASTGALTLPSGAAIKDAAGNDATLTLPATGSDGLASLNLVIDTTARTVTAVSSTATGSYGIGATIPITITFGEAMTVTGTPQLTLNAGSGAVANYESGSGTDSLTFNYVVAAGQNASDLDYASTGALTLNSGSILDPSGNPSILTLPTAGSAADGLAAQNIVILTTAPVVTAVSTTLPSGSYTVGTIVPITVTFGRLVTVTGTPELTLNAGSGAVADYASGSGTDTLTFNYIVAAGQGTPDLDYASTAALALNGGSIQDTVGNDADLTLPATGTDGLAATHIVIDTTPPAATAVSSTQSAGVYGAGTTIPITVSFGEVVNVTGTPQLTLNDGAVVDYASGSGTTALTFNYTVAAGENTQQLDYVSADALTLNGGTIQDATGNAATLTLSTPGTGIDSLIAQNIVIDTTPRTVTAVSTSKPSGTYGPGTSIQISVTFGEPMTVTSPVLLLLNASTGAIANYVSGSGTDTLTFNYNVSTGQNAAILDYISTTALALGDGGSVLDPAGNPADLTLPTRGSTPDGLYAQHIEIVTAPATVTAVSSTAGAYKAGQTVPITVAFSHSVNVSGGAPQLALNDGGVANYVSGSGTTTLTFNYVVGANDNTQDLDYASTGALTLNGATITDNLDFVADLTLPATGTDSLASLNIVIEGAAPTVTAVSTTKSAGTYGAGTTIPINVTFSNPVTVTGTPQLTLNDGAVVDYSSGSGSAILTFNYATAAGESTSDLDYVSTGALALNGGTIQDAAGNVASLTLPATGSDGLASQNIVINTTAPSAGFTLNTVSYDPSNLTTASFTFGSASIVGDTYTYSVTSLGGGGPVTGSGTVGADLTVSGINLTPLIDGQLTFNVTVSDSLGNVGTSATNANLSRTTLTLDSPAYTDANDTQFGFTLNNTTATSYTWVLILSGSPTNVRGSGQIAAGSLPLHVGPVDISSLASGNYLLHVILTEANSSGHAANQTLSLNHSVPAFSIVPNVPYINASTAANAGFAFVGAESNSTCTYTVTDSHGTSISSSTAITVNTPTQSVGGINVSTLADGTLTYQVTLTDFFGNTLTEQATAVLDRVAPTGYSISGLPSGINIASEQNVGFTINSPAAENGDTFVYTITNDQSTKTVTGSGTIAATAQSVTGVDVSSLPDSTLSFSVTLTDKAGNAGAATAPLTVPLNTVAPSGYTIQADANVIGNSTDAANAGFTLNGPASMTGDVYNYTITSTGGGGPVTGSGTVSSATGSQDFTGINLTALHDGTITYSLTLTNAAGNPGTAATATATLATSAPVGFTVTPSQATFNAVSLHSAGFTIGGATVGDTFTWATFVDLGSPPVATPGPTGSGTITSPTQDVTGIDLSGLPAGTVTFSVVLTDVASHASAPVTNTALIDPDAPTAIALSSSSAPDGQPAGSLVGLLETVGPQSGSLYTYSLVSGAGGADNGSFQISGNELLTNAQFDSTVKSDYFIRLQSTDTAGRSIQQQFLITVNAADPIATTLSLSNSTVAANQSAGTLVGDLTADGAILGSQVTYSLVSEPGSSDNNSSFQVVDNQLQTAGPLTAGTYTVRVRSSSTFLISDVVDLSNVAGPYAFQVLL